MKDLLKKFIPDNFLMLYHYFLSWFAAIIYGRPSEKLIVIGVTGTNGKTTTVNLIARVLEEAGYKVGLTSTVNFQIGAKTWLNDMKMTMPGRFFLQRMLKAMVRASCRYAVIECSSEGVLQYRHKNIHYDVLVFTNLAPEHIERHGSFENYRDAKLEYFRFLERLPHKILGGEPVPKVIIVNTESRFAKDFLDFKVDKKYEYSFYGDYRQVDPQSIVIRPEQINLSEYSSSFVLGGVKFSIPLFGPFNVENALKAIAVGDSQQVGLNVCKDALASVSQIPGRQEFIVLGQDFKVLIDYAPEPNSLAALYAAIETWPKERLIHVLGSTGGGRDKSRRQVLGEMAGKAADMVVVTNEDPYDDDPHEIIDQVASGAERAGRVLDENLFKFIDRREAIRFALQSARPNDLVLITGKGAEQAMVVSHGKKLPWDDRKIVREELSKLGFRKR